MSAVTRRGRAVDRLAVMSVEQRLVRLAMMVAPVVMLACAWLAGAHFALWVLVVTLCLALLGTIEPDSHIGLFTMTLLAWYWYSNVQHPVTVWALPAALAVLVLHSATAAAATVPPTAAIGALTRARWWRRVRVVAALTVAGWGVSAAAAKAHAPGDAVLTVVVLLLVAAVAAWLRWAVRRTR